MQVTETLSEGLKRGFSVVVPAADIETKRAARLAELGRTMRLPGFRPGKIPAAIIRQRFGTAVSAEILEDTVNTATQQVLTDRGLRAALQPKVDVVSLDDAKDVEFKIEVELMPDVVLPDFSAIELTRLTSVPAAEAVDTALGEIASRQKEFVTIEEVRPAVKGDTLTVDYLGRIGDVAFEGGTGTDMDVEVGGDGFIPGFTEQMEGMQTGETRTINVTFPAEYGSAELAGKDATFEITVKALKQGVAPALDDELGKKLGFDTLDEVRALITRQMQREYDQLSRQVIKRKLLDALAKLVDFPVPQGMVDAEFDQIWQRVEADRAQGKVDDEDAGKDDDTLKSEYRGIAERRVRLGLLLAEIGRQNNIAVGNEEMTQAMRAEAARYRGQEQQVMEFFRKNPQAVESLRGPLFEEKVVDFVLELAKITDSLVSPEELARDPEATPQVAG